MSEKLTLDIIKERLKSINSDVEILSDCYINQKEKLKCRCKKCGYISYRKWSYLRQGKKCYYCNKNNERVNIEEINNRLKDISPNIEVISSYYKNQETPLTCQCKNCKTKWVSNWFGLRQGRRCPSCYINKHTLNYIKDKLKIVNPDIIILSKEYNNSMAKLKCKCKKCGKILFIRWNSLRDGHGCIDCWYREHNGKNHHCYNPDITDKERIIRRLKSEKENQKRWAKEIYKRDWYKCRVCGAEKNKVAHHLNSYHAFPDERYDINNGVTLCRKHHKEFHTQYGYRNNTKEQFDSYLKSVQ
ncbi:hypothetical protein [Staphylococcus kloosii]|uniref:hypothetical protein n=1 Tax=Staphylococcus kloosii TaxID=29384 RepID=UPI0018A00C5F|nr:hypothetical protein [Staphylococcus kloosii]MBF7029658.1 hypothetical protein [Staphylococcus kloosii]